MMTPIGYLMIEHRLIERMVRLLERERDPEFLKAAVDFFRVYADEGHHGKEEKLLFKALQGRLDPQWQEMMDELIAEHVRGRELVKGLAEGQVERSLEGLVGLYPQHLAKEDKQFFKTARECLSEEEEKEMMRAMEELDRGKGLERYREMVEKWEGQ